MRFHYIMPLKHIRFSEPKGELANRVKFFASGHPEMVPVYRNQNVLMALGSRNLDILYNETLLVFEATTEWCETKFATKNPEFITHQVMNYIKQSADSLWFSMDNSGVTAEGFFISEDKKTVYCDRSDQFSSNAHGEYELVTFGPGQIAYSKKVMENYLKAGSPEPIKIQDDSAESFKQTLGSRLNAAGFIFTRIKRAKTMLHHARSESYLPMKISMYVASLECLFTSDSAEIKFKLTQRVTLFVGGDPKKQKDTKKVVSEAYDVRSTYLHGNRFTKKSKITLEKLQNLSRQIDSIVRTVFINVLEKPDMFLDDEKFDEECIKYFDNLIYGYAPDLDE